MCIKNCFIFACIAFTTTIGAMAQTPVKIGKQKWSSENLDRAIFRNGEAIPQATTNEEWQQAGKNHQPAWCYYGFDATNNEAYGKIYNWYAVNDERGLAPEGWHIPTDAEWEELISYLGGADLAYTSMKSKSGWEHPGTNESGFNAIAAGWCDGIPFFEDGGGYGTCWWSATEHYDDRAGFCAIVDYDEKTVYTNHDHMYFGFYVRCIKGEPVTSKYTWKISNDEAPDYTHLKRLPDKGTFVTVQVGLLGWLQAFDYADQLNTVCRVFEPVFYKMHNDNVCVSIGIFNSVEAAKKFAADIACFGHGPFAVAYKNGNRIALDEFSDEGVTVQQPDLAAAIRQFKKWVYQGYYRIQIGYYEQPGLEAGEQEKHNQLAAAGIKLIEVPYENGRVYQTKKKYATWKEANEEKRRLEQLTGREFLVKGFGTPEFPVDINYLESIYFCLTGE